MIANIRGALGTQVLELLGCFDYALRIKENIDEIHINIGGNIVDTAKVDYISQLFEFDIPVVLTNGTSKYKIWDKNKIDSLFDNLTNILPYFKIKEQNNKLFSNEILHVRASDHFPVKIDNYINFAKNNNCVIIGDNKEVCNDISMKTKNPCIIDSPVVDWSALVHAKNIFISRSSFPLSAFIFDINKNVKYFDIEDGPFPHFHTDKLLYDHIFKKFPNITPIGI